MGMKIKDKKEPTIDIDNQVQYIVQCIIQSFQLNEVIYVYASIFKALINKEYVGYFFSAKATFHSEHLSTGRARST